MLPQEQLSEGRFALLSGEELLEFARQTLSISGEEDFLKVEPEEESSQHFPLRQA